ncbi:hypothetical protein C8R43DRAFT_951875 [Mycena crocata]|nr:hypothetical protein C8R43DRAFT_951875 [Mycena crocata]
MSEAGPGSISPCSPENAATLYIIFRLPSRGIPAAPKSTDVGYLIFPAAPNGMGVDKQIILLAYIFPELKKERTRNQDLEVETEHHALEGPATSAIRHCQLGGHEFNITCLNKERNILERTGGGLPQDIPDKKRRFEAAWRLTRRLGMSDSLRVAEFQQQREFPTVFTVNPGYLKSNADGFQYNLPSAELFYATPSAIWTPPQQIGTEFGENADKKREKSHAAILIRESSKTEQLKRSRDSGDRSSGDTVGGLRLKWEISEVHAKFGHMTEIVREGKILNMGRGSSTRTLKNHESRILLHNATDVGYLISAAPSPQTEFPRGITPTEFGLHIGGIEILVSISGADLNRYLCTFSEIDLVQHSTPKTKILKSGQKVLGTGKLCIERTTHQCERTLRSGLRRERIFSTPVTKLNSIEDPPRTRIHKENILLLRGMKRNEWREPNCTSVDRVFEMECSFTAEDRSRPIVASPYCGGGFYLLSASVNFGIYKASVNFGTVSVKPSAEIELEGHRRVLNRMTNVHSAKSKRKTKQDVESGSNPHTYLKDETS